MAQELSLFPEMDVAANVLIGREPRRFGLVDRRALRRRTAELLGLLGVQLDPRLPVRQLALAERQLVEIAKAMARNPAILVLDEPTSGLREHEVEQLFHVIRRLREQGCAIVFISHRMDEVFAIADRITVLKDGRNSGEVDRADAVRDDIVRMMVGREVDSQFPPRPRRGASAAGDARRPCAPSASGSPARASPDIDLVVHPGEVCGLAGLQGQGQTILLEGLFGLRRATGTLEVGRHRGPFRHPGPAVDAGARAGARGPQVRGRSPRLHGARQRHAADARPVHQRHGDPAPPRAGAGPGRHGRAVACGRPTPNWPLSNLSGGNQQKVVLARWLEAEPRCCCSPTPPAGVDIATKQEIYRIIRAEADPAWRVLLLSTELPELLGLCDRVLVMVDGRIAAEFDGDGLTEEAVMAVAAGAELVHAVTVADVPHGGTAARRVRIVARRSTRRRSPSTACSSPRSPPTSPSTRAR